MAKRSIVDEVVALMDIRPSVAELDEIIEAADTVLDGIVRTADGWQVQQCLSHLTLRRSPSYVVRTVRRGREVAEIARRFLSAA